MSLFFDFLHQHTGVATKSEIGHASGEKMEFGIEDESGAQARFGWGASSKSELDLRALQELASLITLKAKLFQTETPPFFKGVGFQTVLAESATIWFIFACVFLLPSFLWRRGMPSSGTRLSEII